MKNKKVYLFTRIIKNVNIKNPIHTKIFKNEINAIGYLVQDWIFNLEKFKQYNILSGYKTNLKYSITDNFANIDSTDEFGSNQNLYFAKIEQKEIE